MTHSLRHQFVLNCILTLAGCLACLPAAAWAVPQTANDSGSGNWTSNSNWALSVTPAAGPANDDPTSGDAWDVTIDSNTISLAETRTVESLTVGGGGTFNFGANSAIDLTVNGAVDVQSGGTFFTHTLVGSTITATGGFTNNGTFQVGKLNGPPQSDVTISSPSAVINNGLIQVRHNIGWGAKLHIDGAGSITNNAGATLEIGFVGNPNGPLLLESSIANSGSVTINSGSTSVAEFSKANATYTNTATGSYTIDTPVKVSGANSTFTQSGGNVAINSGGSLGGSGLTSFINNGGNLLVDGSLNANLFKHNSGALSANGTIQVAAPSAGSSLELNAGTLSGVPTLSLIGVTYSSGNALSTIHIDNAFNSGNFTGNITAVGKTDITGNYSTVKAGTTLQVGYIGDRQTVVNVPGALTNNGTINITNRSNGWNSALVVPGSLTNSATGLIEFTDPTNTSHNAGRYLDTTLVNAGTVVVREKVINTARIGVSGSTHTNTGLLEVEAGGKLQLVGNSYTQTAGETRVNGQLIYSTPLSLNGGILSGSGVVTADVNATGSGSGLTISPGQSTGKLSITGNMTLDGNDSVLIELGGTTQGALVSGYDFVDVDGLVNLGGSKLTLSMVDDFIPLGTDTFDILTASGGLLGSEFANAPGKILVNDYLFQVTYGANTITLSGAFHVPEPSTSLLLGFGCLGLLRLRRRKAKPSRA